MPRMMKIKKKLSHFQHERAFYVSIDDQIITSMSTTGSVTRKKSPNVYKSCPKMIFTIKIKDFDTFTELSKNVGVWAKLIVAKGFKNLPKVQ